MEAAGFEDSHSRLRERLPAPLHAVIWYDTRDGVYRGVVRELSLFAQASSEDSVIQELMEITSTYCQDAVEYGEVDEMIPRPFRRWEWIKLEAYFWSLHVRGWIANLFRPEDKRASLVVHTRSFPCPV